MTKLRVVPMGLSLGVTWGGGIMLLGWMAALGWGTRLVELFSSLYRGYAPTLTGGIVGGLWGFGDAFLAGLVMTTLYNAFASHHPVDQIHVVPQGEPLAQ
jgi:hypothetical protein